jgi:hypothetical protein
MEPNLHTEFNQGHMQGFIPSFESQKVYAGYNWQPDCFLKGYPQSAHYDGAQGDIDFQDDFKCFNLNGASFAYSHDLAA